MTSQLVFACNRGTPIYFTVPSDPKFKAVIRGRRSAFEVINHPIIANFVLTPMPSFDVWRMFVQSDPPCQALLDGSLFMATSLAEATARCRAAPAKTKRIVEPEPALEEFQEFREAAE